LRKVRKAASAMEAGREVANPAIGLDLDKSGGGLQGQRFRRRRVSLSFRVGASEDTSGSGTVGGSAGTRLSVSGHKCAVLKVAVSGAACCFPSIPFSFQLHFFESCVNWWGLGNRTHSLFYFGGS
jgi:hypothetical protein